MRFLVVVGLLAVLGVPLSGCLSEDPPQDLGNEDRTHAPRPDPHPAPLAPGTHGVISTAYDVGEITVGGPDQNHSDYSYSARLRGHVWAPQGDGPFPLAVFLHGQHATCGFLGRESFVWVAGCEEEPFEPYPNHMGYAYLAEHLASHGVVTASILAKEINQRNGGDEIGMWARGELVLATIDALLDGEVPAVAGKLDPLRVGVMGHSRGGEGVVAAVHVDRVRDTPIGLDGVVALAPTDFNGRGVPDVPFLSIVPYCDGDVSTLHGLRTYDHSRFLDGADQGTGPLRTAKVQLLVMGANHNFYNTAWAREPVEHVYDGDDGRFQVGSAECTLPDDHAGGRLGAEDVKDLAIVQINGFLRWVLLDDASLLPYLDGSAPLPTEACPNEARSCPKAVITTAFLPDRTILWNTTGEAVEPGDGAAGAPTFDGFSSVGHCAGPDCARAFYSAAGAAVLRWEDQASVSVPVVPGALSDQDVFAFRIAVPVDGETYEPSREVPLTVTATDIEGRVHETRVSGPEGMLHQPDGRDVQAGGVWLGTAKTGLHMVRVPLAAFTVPAETITALELRFEESFHERVLLGEAWVYAEGTRPYRSG